MTAPRVGATPETQARLEVVYERVRRSLAASLATIEDATRHLATGVLDESERDEAERAAHRLVGAAETVGFPEATAPARRLEDAFCCHDVRPDTAAVLESDVGALRRILSGDQRCDC